LALVKWMRTEKFGRSRAYVNYGPGWGTPDATLYEISNRFSSRAHRLLGRCLLALMVRQCCARS
jgi:hypothetical protein